MTAGQEVSGGVKGKFLVTLPPQVRYALYREMQAVTATVVRELMMEALEQRGWTESRMRREYVRYAARCIERGEKNLFPGGRV